MSAEARFKHGTPRMVDHTPSGAIAAGEVLKIGELLCIAHNAIAASAKGAVAIGGGVYICTGAMAIPEGSLCFYDISTNKVTLDTTKPRFGYIAPGHAPTADATECWVIHDPGVDEDSATTTTTTTTTT